MTKRQRQVSVLQLCTAKLGQRKGGLAASYVARYAMTQVRLGKFPTAVEYADDWVITERTAWNHREQMHAALGDEWPEIVARVARQIERKKLGVRDAQLVLA